MSRPVWGAWIEIGLGEVYIYVPISSRPVWGAWIEILTPLSWQRWSRVAPRMGRVD